jgi:hypothetical protein
MASFDRKAFLSLPTGSTYPKCSYNNDYSLYPSPSTDIFCAKATPGIITADFTNAWRGGRLFDDPTVSSVADDCLSYSGNGPSTILSGIITLK